MCAKAQGNTRGFKEFMSELKSGDISPVILMYGREDFLISWAVDMLKKRFVPEAARSVDYQMMDRESTADQIIEAANTFSMFSEKRVVWARDLKELTAKTPKDNIPASVQALTRYVSDANERCVLILSSEEINGNSVLCKAVKKYGSYYEFGSLSRPELRSFAQKRFRDAGVSISRSDMELLINETGYFNKDSAYRLFNFENDLAKLIASSSGGTVRKEDIEEIIAGDGEKFIFELLDGISANNKGRAFTILHNRLSASGGGEVFPLIGAIASQMELLLEVKELTDSAYGNMSLSEAVGYLGMNEFRVKKALSYARRFSLEKLRKMLSDVYEINAKIVTGLLDARTALEMFIAAV